MGRRWRLVLGGASATCLMIGAAAAARPVAHRMVAARPPAPPLAPPPLATVSLLVDLPRAQKAGARGAGMLCLPNGAVRVVDLVGGDAALEATVRAALARTGEARLRGGGDIEIHLTDVAVKLCARKWGAFGIGGDHKALSGQARYDFTWHRHGERTDHPATITLDIARDTPLTTDEITGRALDLLLAQIIPAA